MTSINVAAVSINTTPLDWVGNRDRIRRAAEDAVQAGADIICMPELCLSGYGCEDRFLAPSVHQQAFESLVELRRDLLSFSDTMIVGLPVRYRNAVYNCVAVLQGTEIRGVVPKQTLCNDGIHYESRWFKPWPRGRVVDLRTKWGSIPMGDLTFETRDGTRFGFEICEDAWSSQRPGSSLARRGVDLIFNPSASHFAFGKQKVRRQFVVEGSRAFEVGYIYANLVGNESGRIIYDGSTIIAQGGEILREGPRFHMRDHSVICERIDVDTLRTERAAKESFRPEDEIDDQPIKLIGMQGSQGSGKPRGNGESRADWESSDHLKKEEFTRAVALGLFDYLRKTGVRGYAVSLSGGADSSATAVLVCAMQCLAILELGEDYADRLPNVDTDPSGYGSLLTTVYQATVNSSDTTRDAAWAVAEGIGSRHLVLDVDRVVVAYEEIVGEALEVDLSWDDHDIARQNIQARTRGPSVWMVANLLGQILLTPSNRSEASVGYATMDGDTCGGLAPIAGIDKAFLREWLQWMETEGPLGIDPYPFLSYVNAQTPTAELRPPEQEQTDEDDLMPYPVLDRIERAFVRDRKSPTEIHKDLTANGMDKQEAKTHVRRFFDLWCKNQWKRERYAPAFHLDDENVDPKTGCRFPILSGRYDTEIDNL